MGRETPWRLGAALVLPVLVWWMWRDSTPTSYYLQKVEPRMVPVVFITGIDGSGLNLMRAILEAHPNIDCGRMTSASKDILRIGHEWKNHRTTLAEGGISTIVLNNAIAAFYLEVSRWSREPEMQFCNKDELMKEKDSYLVELFPKAKFLFMVRDGRATVHSLISRKLTVHGVMVRSYEHGLKLWNVTTGQIYRKCKNLGSRKCMMVRYETLVLQPRATMQTVLKFLGQPWDEEVLHHELYVNTFLSTTKELIGPINKDALDKWVDGTPRSLRLGMAEMASMLTVLGYDPEAYPPKYEELHTFPPLIDLPTQQPEPGAAGGVETS